MKLNHIIKKQRKALQLTQEQLAKKLNVSIAAVSKWETNLSYPDITLLPVLARTLKIDINTLLGFNQQLTDLEITLFSNELSEMMEKEGLEKMWIMAQEKIKEYPYCEGLIYMVSMLLEGGLMMYPQIDKQEYIEYIDQLNQQLLDSSSLTIKQYAQTRLFQKAITQQDFNQANQIVENMEKTFTEPTLMKAQLQVAKKEYSEAQITLEGMIASKSIHLLNPISLLMKCYLALSKYEEANHLIQVAKQFSNDFEILPTIILDMELEYYIALSQMDKAVKSVKDLLEALHQPWSYQHTKLYKSLPKKEDLTSYTKQMILMIILELKSNEAYKILWDDENFKELIDNYQNMYN